MATRMATACFSVYFSVCAMNCLVIASANAAPPAEIWPSSIDLGTATIRGAHLIYAPTTASNGKLLITLGGTSSLPKDFEALHMVAQQLGYDVIAVDYPNEVITRRCAEALTPEGGHYDSSCFDFFRLEIVFGENMCPLVGVSPKNSIHYRIESLLRHLRTVDKKWDRYFDGKKINWSRIVLLGHSQGSGHAAFLAKLNRVDRVVLFGGPQDVIGTDVAPWLLGPSQTPESRYLVLLHSKDIYFRQGLQQQAVKALFGGKVSLIRKNVIVSTAPTTDGHMSMLGSSMESIWRDLLN